MPALTFDELDRLTRELASFARAGITIPQGLRQLAVSLKRGRLRQLAADLAQATEKGKSLSEALEASPLVPRKEFIALVRCAEISGDFRSILDFAVEHSRRIKRHRSALLTTTVYPILVVITFLGTLYFLCNAIIPKIEAIYAQLHATLPSLTQFLVDMAYAFQGAGGLVLLVVIIALIQGTLWWEPARETMYRLVGILPGFHSLVALSDTAVFMKFVGRMTARGVPLPPALRAASLAVWHTSTRKSLEAMSDAAEKGHPVGPLLGHGVPSTAAWLFRQAEQRGDLPQTCEGIADYCEDRFDRLSKRTLAVLEPLLVLLVALLIAATITGVYMPLFWIPRIVSGAM